MIYHRGATAAAAALLCFAGTTLSGCGGGASTTKAPGPAPTAAPGSATTVAPVPGVATTTVPDAYNGAPPYVDFAKDGFRGISWGSLYLGAQSCLTTFNADACSRFVSSDIAADWGGPLWNTNTITVDWEDPPGTKHTKEVTGRGDLDNMKELGANVVRLYGNDARVSKKAFFDYARTNKIQVFEGFTGFDYNEPGGKNCATAARKANCYTAIKDMYGQVLLNGGFIDNGYYHNAIAAVNLANEPDFYGIPGAVGGADVPNYLEAMVMAFDGFLTAEKEAKVKPWTDGSMPKITCTWSFANGVSKNVNICKSEWGVETVEECGPGYAFMIQFARAVQNPAKYLKYTPQNADLAQQYKSRWINTIQLFVDGATLKTLFLDGYMKSDLLKDTPIMATEWGAEDHRGGAAGLTASLTAIAGARTTYPNFWGVSIFEYSKAYNKDGKERTYGMLGYGPEVIGKTGVLHAVNPDGTATWDNPHDVNCITNYDPTYLKALTDYWKGTTPTHGMCKASASVEVV